MSPRTRSRFHSTHQLPTLSSRGAQRVRHFDFRYFLFQRSSYFLPKREVEEWFSWCNIITVTPWERRKYLRKRSINKNTIALNTKINYAWGLEVWKQCRIFSVWNSCFDQFRIAIDLLTCWHVESFYFTFFGEINNYKTQ